MTALELIQLIGSSLSLFLMGANVGFLASIGQRVVPWFTIKIGAVTLLLGYVCLSLVFGHPSWSRSIFGLFALVADCVALLWMWRAIDKLESRKIVGLIPLIRPTREVQQ